MPALTIIDISCPETAQAITERVWHIPDIFSISNSASSSVSEPAPSITASMRSGLSGIECRLICVTNTEWEWAASMNLQKYITRSKGTILLDVNKACTEIEWPDDLDV